MSSRLLAPRMKVSMMGEVATISPDPHPEAGTEQLLLMEALGSTEPDFVDGLLRQLASVAAKGRAVDEDEVNFMLAVVKGVEPKDQVEAMLAAQMAAVHNATMSFARRLALVETLPQQDSTERAFNKLARTFASQMEALKRYRSRGEQTVRVEHVTVNEGGQAIVGHVTHGGRVSGARLPRCGAGPYAAFTVRAGERRRAKRTEPTGTDTIRNRPERSAACFRTYSGNLGR